ncbi:AraC family transcriptional regulator [soil metagenome]
MKPELRQVISNSLSSFEVRRDIGDAMINRWHYHPEIELLYIKRSAGTWLVGDYIGPFQSGDIILLGSNLPHCFRHESHYVMHRDDGTAETICIKFSPEIFGNDFFNLPETRLVDKLLSNCNCGLKLTGKIKNKLAETIDKITEATPGKKLVYLLSILEEIAESKAFIPLSSQGFIQSTADINKEKIKLIVEYTFNHFTEKISLDQVAALVNMTKQSFCRYFKNKTKKTYIGFLMEVRIGYACRLLMEDDKNVTEISYETGYNNISHFNHQFKIITNKSPLEYKRDYIKMQPVN